MMGVRSLVPAVQLFHPARRPAVRVQVKRAGVWHDITNRVHRGTVRHNNDDPVAVLDLTLLNGVGFDSLAPRIKTSPLNRFNDRPKWSDYAGQTWQDLAGLRWIDLPLVDRYGPLLDRYNEILVEAAFSTDGSTPSEYIPVFHGLLGDSIRTEHNESAGVVVHVNARDMAKRLQDDMILERITFRDMYASQIIQALLDARFGPGVIQLRGIGEDDFFVEEVTFEYVDTWQAIQSFCEQSDKDVRFMLDESDNTIKLTYWTPDTTMTPVWSIGASGIVHETLETSDASLRHRVVVRYIDADGNRREIIAEDLSNKKPNEPIRAALIEEGDTSAIRDDAAASRFANAVLSALKTEPATDSLRLPFDPRMRIYDVIEVTNPGVRSEPELYAIEELRFNFSADEWWTEVVASESVKVRHQIWLEKEAKKGVAGPLRPEDVAPSRLLADPAAPTVTSTLRGISVSWPEPTNARDWRETVVRVYDASDSLVRTLRGRFTSVDVTGDLTAGDTYSATIQHVDIRGDVTAESERASAVAGKVGNPDIDGDSITSDKIKFRDLSGNGNFGPINPGEVKAITTDVPDLWGTVVFVPYIGQTVLGEQRPAFSESTAVDVVDTTGFFTGKAWVELFRDTPGQLNLAGYAIKVKNASGADAKTYNGISWRIIAVDPSAS